MEVKVVFSLDNSDTSMLADLLAVLAKGQISSLKKEVELEVTEAPAEEKVEAPKKKEKKTKKVEAEAEEAKVEPQVEATVEAEPVEDVKHATLEDIRTIARKLADEGRQKEYRPILEKYGYAKVNLIEEKNFDAIYNEMIQLVGEENA